MKKKIFAACLTALGMAVLTACGSSKPAEEPRKLTEEEQDALGAELAEQADQMTEDLLSGAQAMEEGFLDQFTGEMDLEGSWTDETSQRAQMDISMNEDGSCTAMIYWGGSAVETAVWEITGTYDPVSGGLSYDSARHYVHVVKEDGTDAEEDETTTDGSLSKVGNRLLWHDSANDYEDHFFARTDAENVFDGYYVNDEDDTLYIQEEDGSFSVEALIGGISYRGILNNDGEGLSGSMESENGDSAEVTILHVLDGMELTVDGADTYHYEIATDLID